MSSRFVEDPRFVRKYDVRVEMMVGTRAAIFIQQVHYHATWKSEKYKTLEWRSSISEWEKTFPGWSRSTIRQIIKDCHACGVLKIRKETTRAGESHWFSLDYKILDEIGSRGEQMIEEVYAKNEHTPETPVENQQPPMSEIDKPPVGNQHHLLHLSTTAVSTTNKRSDATASPSYELLPAPQKLPETATAPPPRRATPSSAELKKTIRTKHQEQYQRNYDEKHSPSTLMKLWQFMLNEAHGKKAAIGFTAKDRKNTDAFIKWCDESGERADELLSWCIANWDSLRAVHMKWANLTPMPLYGTIMGLKEYFLTSKRAIGGGKREAKPREVFTSVDQIPMDHPLHAQLKLIVETVGRAEVL
jgi:hypothetical protein